MKKLSLKVEKRTIFGRKVKQLRNQKILPANLYGKDVKSQALKIDLKDFLNVYKEAGETNVVELYLDKQKNPTHTLIHNLQIHPIDSSYLHVDFHKIDLTKKVQVTIPIEILGEAPGVVQGGVLVQVLNEVEVEALPADLPDKLVVDVANLKEIGDYLTIKDLKIDVKKVKILVEDLKQIVVNLKAPKEEVEEAPQPEVVPEEEKPKEETTEKEKAAAEPKAEDKDAKAEKKEK
ncbi:hypothetical protein A3J78_00555 [Candidatus Beckwithbacteria bacterium RBG_13_35_6]|uniref:Large ribosomal subunit protein bL25 n=1 Tax=Candidatus Beckwithbacteria bacterium RBG_13_35_6 TaxID=1797456 RepID=A0A1F5DEI3_9BACT|nr:MAG: hypothetical protein A3J78_00555 [Candidatus Beckwithbacteria bacterium RBG_13_35_6]